MARRAFPYLLTLFVVIAAAPPVFAAWVWSPQTGWIGPTGAVKDSPEEQLAFATAFFNRQDYKRARMEFRKLLRSYKDSPEAPEAQYYLGRCEEELRDYYNAFLEYRKTVQVYPSTKRLDEILEREYQIGNLFLSGKKRKLFGTAALIPARDKAVEIFQAIADDGPFSEHGQLAQYKLGLAHLALHDYEQAVSAFEQVISRYPESPLVDDARFQITLASLKGTFKPGYDQSPTDHAIRGLQAFLTTYSEGELTDQARKRLTDLEELRAEHEYLIAQFYERRHRPIAARVYYAAIVDQYASSAWAPKAAARLEVLESRVR